MRTTLSTIKFRHPFTLNEEIGELPAGSYDLEIDEDEFHTTGRTVYVRVAAHLYVRDHGSMRIVAVNLDQLSNALADDTSLLVG